MSSNTPSFTTGYSNGSSPAFLLVPSSVAPTQQATALTRPKPSFPVSSAILHPPSHPQRVARTSKTTAFKAPAHKHAHHLHSIPPREKSTRALILDHMLWQHDLARFAQARCDLGMGGVGNARRSELGMEPQPGAALDEPENADMEPVEALGFGRVRNERMKCFASSSEAYAADTLFRQSVDAVSAANFKARADGLDKVLSAMMDQPPEISSFDTHSTSAQLLPNGVRLRLALAALVNDLFSHTNDDDGTREDWEDELEGDSGSRCPPSPPPDSPMSISSIVSSNQDSHMTPIPTLNTGQPGPSDQPLSGPLAVLARVSSFAPRGSTESSGSGSLTLPSLSSLHPGPSNQRSSQLPGTGSGSNIAPPAGSIFSTIPRGAGPESPWALGSHLSQPASRSNAPSRASGSGAFFPPPAFNNNNNNNTRLPSPSSILQGHAYTSQYDRPFGDLSSRGEAPPARVWRAVGRSKVLYNSGVSFPRSRNASARKRCSRHFTLSCSCASSRQQIAKSTIGAGLSRPHSIMRKTAPRYHTTSSNARRKSRNARIAELLPRFLRLSALAARELGREARGEEDGEDTDSVAGEKRSSASETDDEEDISSSYGCSEDGARKHARPTKEWYALLTGLLTRAVLEGYVMCGWKGTDGVEVLMGLGTQAPCDKSPSTDLQSPKASNHKRTRSDDLDDTDSDDGGYFSWNTEDDAILEPDEMPTLEEASRILFPGAKSAADVYSASVNGWEGVESWVVGKDHRSSPNSSPVSVGDMGGFGSGFGGVAKTVEEEYEKEMADRVSEFLSVSPHSPSLLSHLEEMAERYPPEPVERAALRFCEAVSKWRGMPELETCKARPLQKKPYSATTSTPPSTSSSTLSISSLINHSNMISPPKPRPPIESYFTIPRAGRAGKSSSPVNVRKKMRRDDTIRGMKRHRASLSEVDYIPPTWTGPYGI